MSQAEKTEKIDDNLSENLKELAEISSWFDEQREVDIENGLEKVRRAAELIKASKKRLSSIENQFKEIKKDIDEEISSPEPEFINGGVSNSLDNNEGEEINVEDIPF